MPLAVTGLNRDITGRFPCSGKPRPPARPSPPTRERPDIPPEIRQNIVNRPPYWGQGSGLIRGRVRELVRHRPAQDYGLLRAGLPV